MLNQNKSNKETKEELKEEINDLIVHYKNEKEKNKVYFK